MSADFLENTTTMVDKIADAARETGYAQGQTDALKACELDRKALEEAESKLAGLVDTVASATRNNGRNSDHIKLDMDLREAVWQLSYDAVSARQQCEQWRRDALRYRLIREQVSRQPNVPHAIMQYGSGSTMFIAGDELDERLDAAMQVKK